MPSPTHTYRPPQHTDTLQNFHCCTITPTPSTPQSAAKRSLSRKYKMSPTDGTYIHGKGVTYPKGVPIPCDWSKRAFKNFKQSLNECKAWCDRTADCWGVVGRVDPENAGDVSGKCWICPAASSADDYCANPNGYLVVCRSSGVAAPLPVGGERTLYIY